MGDNLQKLAFAALSAVFVSSGLGFLLYRDDAARQARSFAAEIEKRETQTSIKARTEDQERLRRSMRYTEAMLRQCASSLSADIGRRDALGNIRRGDHRLYRLELFQQENMAYEFPGLPSGIDMTAHKFVTSPKGLIFSDPWTNWRPQGANACDRATREYVASFNRTVLQQPRPAGF